MIAGYTVLLFILLGIFMYRYMTRNFSYWKNRGVPFLKPVPIFGNIKDICFQRTSIGEYLGSVFANNKVPFIGFFILDEPCLLINDLDIIKNILIKDFEYFHDRTMTNNEKHDPIGSNILFIIKSQKWRDLRRKMTPAFSSGKMKLMSKLTLQCGEQMIDYMREKIKTRNTFEVRELCAKFATNSITSTAFGLEAGCFKDEYAPFRVISRRIFNWQYFWHAIQTTCFFLAPKLVHLFRMQFIDSVCTEFFKNVFLKTMKERERTKFVRNDLLDILIEMKSKITDDTDFLDENQIVAQAAQFFMAGFESSSNTMCFLLLELARHPDIQERVREEIISLRQKHDGFDYFCLHEMEYLEKTINETVRKYPVLPFLDRRCSKRYEISGSHLVLEEGEKVYIPVLGIHNDPTIFPEPELFKPDRFDKIECEQRHSMAFLGFGEGPRNCIGRRYGLMSVKSGMVHLLSNFRVKLCKETGNNIKFSPKGFTLQPEKGIILEFEELNAVDEIPH